MDKLESDMKKLSEIVEKLEGKDNSLSDALKLFEQGVKLTDECLRAINAARGKITLLQKEMDKLTEKPFAD